MTRRTLPLPLAIVGVVAGLAAYAVTVTSDHEPRSNGVMFVFILLGWAFIASGLLAAARRPDSRFGWLLAAVGFAWFAAGLGDANNAILFTVGNLLGSLWIAFFVHALLVFPDGRLDGWVAKACAALVYFICTVMQVIALLFMDPVREIPECASGRCPDNLVLVNADGGIFNAISGTQNMIGGVIGIGALYVLIQRWRRASIPLRRTLGPVFVAAGIFMCGYIVLLIVDLTAGISDDGTTAIVLALYGLIPPAFLFGVLRGRLEQASVGRLVEELGSAEPGHLRDALRRTLRDPSLEVAYWIPETATYVDSGGRPVTVTETPDAAVTVVEHAGARVAAVIHDPSLAERQALTRSAFAAAGIALANERLQADLRARLEELRASRARIVEAGDSERRRLERNLHDGAQQRLVALSVSLRLARSRLASDPEEADRILAGAGDELTAALAELRELARGLHPAALDRGLEPALRALTAREPLPVELAYTLGERLPQPVEAAAYYVVAEALTNVAKYASATLATVAVARANGRAVVRVTDDGVGGADMSRGSGLRGLRDRVEALDGQLRVESPTGGGTVVVAEIPMSGRSG